MMVRPRARTVEARQWLGDNVETMRHWLGYAFIETQGDKLIIEDARTGRVVVCIGEWIVKDDGWWVMELVKFHAYYEAIEGNS